MSRSSWSAKSPAMPAVMSPSAVAGGISPAHNGTADNNVAPSIPKYNLVQPQSQPLNAFTGSIVQTDIIVDKSIGKALNYFVQLDVTFANSHATDPKSGYLASAASLFANNAYDELVNGSVAETVYSDNLFVEGMVMKSDQELAQHSTIWGISFDASGNPIPSKITVPSLSSVKKTYYVPLIGLFSSAQLFLAGISDEIRFRVYLDAAPLCGANGFVSDPEITLSLNNLQLWVEEASLSAETFNALQQQHKSGVTYRSMLRTPWQRTQPTLTAGSQQTDILNSFGSDSSALLVYLTNPSLDNGYFMTRYNVKSLQLLDAGGSTLTRVLEKNLIEQYITTSVTPVASSFVNSTTFNTYIIPFCSSLERVLNCASRPLGGLKLSSMEQLSLIIENTRSTPTVENVLSWDYAAIRVQNGKMKWARTAGELDAWGPGGY